MEGRPQGRAFQDAQGKAVLKKRNFLYFFYLPLLVIAGVFFLSSSFNRRYIQTKVENLVREQLLATSEILKVSISFYLEEKRYPVDKILELYSQEENIYYMAVLDADKEILGWRSRFEGYLPLSIQEAEGRDAWTIDSPAGKIFNLFSSFSLEEKQTYYLYLGYSLLDLEAMLNRSRRNFYFIFGVIFIVGAVVTLGLYRLQIHSLAKEREAEKATREMERYREISAFTSGVAHEIRNPLNSLSLLFELLETKAPLDIKEEISPGKDEIRKISRIIEQFSASLKPLKLNKEKFVLEDFFQSILISLKKEDKREGVEIEYSQKGRIVVKADKNLLGQALLNLLRNALDATEEGKIFVRARREKKMIRLIVQDEGKGIPDEDKGRVFEPFFSRKKKGMGIGLYITKKIVEAHEGKIELTDSTMTGTVFTLDFPGG